MSKKEINQLLNRKEKLTDEEDVIDAFVDGGVEIAKNAKKTLTGKKNSYLALLLKELLGSMIIAAVVATVICFFPTKPDLLAVSIITGGITMAVHAFFSRTSPNDFNMGITLARLGTFKISPWEAIVLLVGNAAGNFAGAALTIGFVGFDTYQANAPSKFNPYGIPSSFDHWQAIGALSIAQFAVYFLGSTYDFVFTRSKQFGKSVLLGGLGLVFTFMSYPFASGGINFFYALATSATTLTINTEFAKVYLLSNLISVVGTLVVYWIMQYFEIKIAEAKSNKE